MGLDFARIADEERCVHAFLVHETLVEPSVLAHVEPLVGGIDNNGVLGKAVTVEVVEDFAYALVNRVNDRQIVAQIGLVLPFHQCPSCELVLLELVIALAEIGFIGSFLLCIHPSVFGNGSGIVDRSRPNAVNLEVEHKLHVFTDFHFLCVGSRASCGIVVPHSLRDGEGDVVVHAKVLCGGEPATVGSLMMNHQAERLLLVAVVKELDGMLCDELGGIAFLSDILAMRVLSEELWIVVSALIPEYVVIVKSLGCTHEVPLANHARLVASLLEHFREEGAGGIDAFEQHALSILMAIESCDGASTAGGGE